MKYNIKARELQRIFPHGMKKAYFTTLIDWTIKMYNERGVGFLTAIALGQKDPENEIVTMLFENYIKENGMDFELVSQLNSLWHILVNKYESPFNLILSNNKKQLATLITKIGEI